MADVVSFTPFEAGPPVALYLHIPFCERKCPYCDFNTYAGMASLQEPFSLALAQDIRRWGNLLGHPPLQTLFIGGGTPTVLSTGQLARILEAVYDSFSLLPGAEITSEANPGTVDQAKFQALYDFGVNRLSLGAQSFDDEELHFLGRIHTAADVVRAVQEARRVGFGNINLDLIYGLPGQTPEHWETNVHRALDLAPTHLSCYALTVEEGTPLAHQVATGRVPPTDDDVQGEMYARTRELLADAGYFHYEISNWACLEYPCAHNLVYWRHQPYLGLGPGAHSFDGAQRWWTVRLPHTYIRHIEAGESVVDGWEPIPRDLAMGETMILGLRLLQEGVSRVTFRTQFGIDPVEHYGHTIERLVTLGLLSVTSQRIRLNARAYAVANQVFVHFLP